MQQIVSPEPVLGGVPEAQLLELAFQVIGRHYYGTQKYASPEIFPESCHGACRLLRGDSFAARLAVLENVQLKSVVKLQPIKHLLT